ncbi:N-lysine methyltransferase KMT5A-A-like isoform X2 [Stigmatopora argus]
MAKGKKQTENTEKINKISTAVTSKEAKENQPLGRQEDCNGKVPVSDVPASHCAKPAIQTLSGMLLQKRNGIAAELQQKEAAGSTNMGCSSVPAPKNPNANHRKGKKGEEKGSQNSKLTDFFPIRKSNRKTTGELKNEKHKHLGDVIKNDVEEGMQVRVIHGKGRGVFAQRTFRKGDFVVEYHGDLLEPAQAKQREACYTRHPGTGCYMYYFCYRGKAYCVDATEETGRMGRLVNHSKVGNCQTRVHAVDGRPHLILVASRDILPDEEFLYDYGDRSKEAISAHPWLKL